MARSNPLGAWARLMGRNLALIQRKLKQAGRLAKAQAAQAGKLAKVAKTAARVSRVAAKKIASAAAKTGQPARRQSKPGRVPAQAAGKAAAGRSSTGVALGPVGARRFTVFRPAGIARGERLPLLVMLHGCQQDAAGFALCTRMNTVATRERFIVLYPEQDRLANAQGCWNWFSTRHGRAAGEAALILQAISQVCLLHPVDASRIAVAGLSAGASMAALLASLQPQRFKAVVMHSGIPPGTADSGLSALGAMRGRRRTRPLDASAEAMAADWPALLVIHGSADRVVAPANAQAAVQAWADAAGARASAPRLVQRGQRYPISVTDYRCQGRTVATLALVQGLGHAWSGGGAGQPFADAHGPDAARMVWAFALRQFGKPLA